MFGAKKFVLALALVASAASPALAQSRGGGNGPREDRQERREDRQERREDRQEDRRDERRSEVIAAAVVGGVIGLIAADQFDRNDRGPGYGPGPGRGGPGPGRGGGYYPPQRPVICFAENRRGQVFRGRGPNARIAQREAIDQCYAYRSRQCFPTGCQR